MAVEWRKQMFDAATEEVTQFIQNHSDYSLDAKQPQYVEGQLNGGGTNFVLWGHHQSGHVVFKYFHPEWGANRWRNERACLQHFASTRWVPEIHAVVPETLIVMSSLLGKFINIEADSGELDADGIASLARELGGAVGRMVNLPLPEDGDRYSVARDFAIMPWNTDLCEAVRFYLKLCRRDQKLSPTGADSFYDESLSLVEGQVDRIPNQRHVIYHEDFHCFSHRGKLQGVFDLELARLGTELMQLERVFRQCSQEGLQWTQVLEGYQAETGRSVSGQDYAFMLAMGLFYYHIRITRWGTPDTKADYVAKYLPDLREEAWRYANYLDLGAYLPSLQ